MIIKMAETKAETMLKRWGDYSSQRRRTPNTKVGPDSHAQGVALFE